MRVTIAMLIAFSCVINILALSSPFFMLEVYDRVLPSRSLPTLSSLLILVTILFLCSGALDIIRHRMMERIAGIVDTWLSYRVFTVISGTPLKAKISGDALKPAREMDQIRNFLTGPGPMALFDLPWMPVYLAICFFLHPLIGGLAAGVMFLLIILTLITDLRSRSLLKKVSTAIANRNSLGEAAHRSAETLAAMGMNNRVSERWTAAERDYLILQRRVTDIGSTLSSISRTLRYMLQSFTLGLGAYLVLNNDMTGGMIFASSIIVARALQPAEQAIAQWRSFLTAFQAWQRLQDIFQHFPEKVDRTVIPAPYKILSVKNLFVSPPGASQSTVQNVTFDVKAGSAIGIIGSSGSGKSSLVRALIGVWPSLRGEVRLDGATLDKWSEEERGQKIGYLPQTIDFLPGTIAENISRFGKNVHDKNIVSAAQAAGVHDLIMTLPEGYETRVEERGFNLSAGQKQRIALARALYGNPFLVVLDEPNSNLDFEGERALLQAIDGIRKRGGIVIVVAHRNSVMPVLDFILMMEKGLPKAFGKKDSVLKTMRGKQQSSSRTPSPPNGALHEKSAENDLSAGEAK